MLHSDQAPRRWGWNFLARLLEIPINLSKPKHRTRCRPFLEQLEDRTTPAAIPFFTPPEISTSVDGPLSVSTADLDGDGDTDVLSASDFDDTIAWYENDGASSPAFTLHTISTIADRAFSVAAADVDGDGDLDVVSASFADAKIAWYENDGAAIPTFTLRTISTTAQGATSVTAADVDGDGDTDILSASDNDHKIAWYENNGAAVPTFTLRTISTTAMAARSVATADVDGDGDIDVLSASFNDDKIAWYENDGAAIPAFTLRTISTTADQAISVNAADVDGDGDIDVLSASEGDDKVAWYENNGAAVPTFSLHTISTFADEPISVAAADLDGDGDTDVLSACHGDDKIAWYENDGATIPEFTLHTISTSTIGAYSVAVADVDGDGDIDVLSASRDDDKVSWFRNDVIHKGANYPQLISISGTATGARSVVTGDLDGDGDLDVVSASHPYSSFDGKVAWYENNGSDVPSFTLRTISSNAFGASTVTIGDLDGDGDLDVVAGLDDANTIFWYENDGAPDPVFTERLVTNSAVGVLSVTLVDLNDDGNLDVLAAAGSPTLAWYDNVNGNGSSFTPRFIDGSDTRASDVTAADLDGDGDLDVVASVSGESVLWYENNGAAIPTFTERTINDVAYGASGVAVADLDGDGDLDVLSSTAQDDKIAWYENDGAADPSFTLFAISLTADDGGSLAAADLDGDGDVDVLSSSFGDNKIAWYENDGAANPVFTLRTITTSAIQATDVGVADLDDDGDLDVLSASLGDDTIAWYPNEGGQYLLTVTNDAPLLLNSQQVQSLLTLTLANRGLLSDPTIRLASLELLFEESPGDPLSEAEFNLVIQDVAVFFDTNGNGTFDINQDSRLPVIANLSSDSDSGLEFITSGNGTVTLTFASSASFVPPGVSGQYFVTLQPTADATRLGPGTLRLSARPGKSKVVDENDTPLKGETSPDGSSSVVRLVNPVLVATGSDAGSGEVRVYDARSGRELASFLAYDVADYDRGVQLAVADVSGDGVPDVITAPGAGLPGGAVVRVVDGADLLDGIVTELSRFHPFGVEYLGQVFVAAADFDADGRADVVTGNVSTKSPTVNVFNGIELGDSTSPLLGTMKPFSKSYKGGARVTVGNVNGDAFLDVIASQSKNGSQFVAISGADFRTVLTKATVSDTAIAGGIFVTAGNMDNDAQDEIIVGFGAGMKSHILLVEDRSVNNTLATFLNKTKKPVFGSAFNGGVRVAAIDLDGAGQAEILTTAGSGLASYRPRVLDGFDLKIIDEFFADAPIFLYARSIAVGKFT